MPDCPITKAQVRSIHVALYRQGIDGATYRSILYERYGVETSKTLTRLQASDLLTRIGRPLLQAAAPRPTPPRPEPVPKGAPRLVTAEQRELIAKLSGEIGWREPKGYAQWLRANMGLERIATSAQGAKVIQGLKAIKERRGAA